MTAIRTLLAALAAALAVACVIPVQSQTYETGSKKPVVIHKVAIAPFQVSEEAARNAALPTDPRANPSPPPEEAAEMLGRYMAEALAARGVEVVPAGDVRRAAGLSPGDKLPPVRTLAELVQRQFGVPALLIGTLHRFRERSGEAMGSTHPASVWFDVLVVSAPGGARLWAATFNETQKALSDNVLATSRYPGGGTRWLRAEELGRWGAQEVAKQFPAGP